MAVHLAQEQKQNPLGNLGASPVGVDTAISWFLSKVLDQKQVFLFLVGGPGGGKSHATAKIVSKLTEIGVQSQLLAHRKHRYEVPNTQHKVMVINDATIRGRDHNNFPLIRDIVEAVETGASLVCCVNRGVLVEEAACELPEFEDIVKMVRALEADQSAEAGHVTSNVLIESTFRDSIPTLRLAFDLCSLFEPTPESFLKVSEDTNFKVSSDPYRIIPFEARLKSEERFPSTGSDLLLKVAKAVSDDYNTPEEMFDPLAANLETLTKQENVESVCSVVRAAELIASRRFSYRELWGLTARAILGDAPKQFSSDDLPLRIKELQPSGTDAIKRFSSFMKLGDLRFNQALFGASSSESPNAHLGNEVNPIVRMMAPADPFRDMQPGVFRRDDSRSGWATPLHDAFSGAISATSPLHGLLQTTGDTSFKDFVTDFDLALDAQFVAAMGDPKLERGNRETFISWYSGYLTRMFALSLGVSAFVDVVVAWTRLWNTSPLIPAAIEEQFLTLLRPSRQPESAASSSLIPLYESRTLPIQGELSEPKLALRVNEVEVRTNVIGDALELILEENGQPNANVLLDFTLLREALACINGYTGVTELSTLTAPRLERIRASNLISSNQFRIGKFRVATSEGEEAFKVEVD